MSAYERQRVALIFGGILRTLRMGANLSQEELADRAGIDCTTPSLYERGLRQPTLAVVLALAEAFEIEPAALVTMTVSRLRREVTR